MPATLKALVFALIAATVAIAVWVLLSVRSGDSIAVDAPLPQELGAGSLDGLTFLAGIGPMGKPADIEDRLSFQNGVFTSSECARYCNYPPSAYFVREVEGAVEFVSESRCPHKDAVIVWRGQVRDGTIEGVATWTNRRWYWTIEKDLAFTGKILDPDSPLASAD